MAKRAQSDTVQLKARMKEPLRAKLEAEAEAGGISLNAEMIRRLESTFRGDAEERAALKMFGFHPNSYLAWRLLGDAISNIERASGKCWQEDWDTGQRVQEAFQIIVSAYGEPPPAEDRLSPKGREKSETRKLKNTVAAKEAVLSALRAQVPGLKAVERLLAEERESNENAAEGKPEK